MATYQYKARDKFGKSINGLMDAESEGQIASKLREMRYVPVSIKPAQESSGLSSFMNRFRRIRLFEVNMFTEQLAVLQKAGVPILLSLKTINEGTINKNLKDIIGQVSRDIEAGANLSSALAKHPAVFKPLYVNMIKTAEASGTLGQVLERLVALGEYEEKFRLRIKAATRYPILVVIAIIIGFLILTTLVIPRFTKIYSQFSAAWPLPTRMLIWLNLAITRYWWVMIIAGGACILAFQKFINTEKGRILWDNFKLKVPVFGPLELKLIMSRFTRIMGTLMKSGVGLFEILDLSSDGVGNVIVFRTIENIKKSVSEGKGLSEPMRISGIFPPIVVQMISVGEQTGKLDDLLMHVSDYYDAQVEYTVSNLTALIEPFLICILGCAVLFMALGIFLPMWNLMNLFRR